MDTEDHKPTFEERMQALAVSLELLSTNMHAAQEKAAAMDARERKGREALLAGIAAYLRALGSNEEEAQ